MIDWIADIVFLAVVIGVVVWAANVWVTAAAIAFGGAMMWTLATGGRWP